LPFTAEERSRVRGHPPVEVVTVDDQAIFRAVARDVIEATPGFEAVGEAASGQEALRMVGELQPQLVLVDVRMPGMDGIETTRRLRAAHPETVVVLVSLAEPADLPSSAGFCGAAALVRKQDLRPALLRGLWSRHGDAD
jgi:two-component system invasion response regulator UvrY